MQRFLSRRDQRETFEHTLYICKLPSKWIIFNLSTTNTLLENVGTDCYGSLEDMEEKEREVRKTTWSLSSSYL